MEKKKTDVPGLNFKDPKFKIAQRKARQYPQYKYLCKECYKELGNPKEFSVHMPNYGKHCEGDHPAGFKCPLCESKPMCDKCKKRHEYYRENTHAYS
ncbi:MAG: hypothetical protein MJ252_06395 [archaeon]|nr:hypothetical protein [archaeon]